MKKLAILAALTLMSLAATCWAQKATVLLNNFDANGGNGYPIFYQTTGTLPPAGTTITAQLLGGPVGGALAPVASTSGQSLITIDSTGFFDVGVGVVPGVTPGAQADFELQAWEGSGTFATATKAGSIKWSQATGTWNDNTTPPPPPSGATLNIPSSVLVAVVPEPSTIALGLIGAAALLIRRRK